MTTTTDDSLEPALRELFTEQAAAVRPSARDGFDVGLSSVEPLDRGSRRRTPMRIAVAAAVTALVLVGGALLVRQRSGTSSVATASSGGASQPATADPRDFSTRIVTFRAQDLSIDVGDQHFVAAGPPDDLHSDAGNAEYETLEVTWTEHDVEMRWNIYLASDGVDWWVSEMRTYNGAERGDWVTFTGEQFRTPLGQAFTGDVDLTASEDGYTSHLVVTGMELQGFLPH